LTEPDISTTDAILRRHGIDYVIIGGQAIARTAATTTQDIDVMVTTTGYETAIERLRGEPDLTFDWESDRTARFRIRSLGGVPLDIVNAATFSGNKTGEDFFAYLAGEGSSEHEGIRYAAPEMVWYTRLLTKRWRAYAEKIVTNVIDGVAADRLGKVEEIAQRFGTEPTVKPRIQHVRTELSRPDVQAIVRSG
jgi:hypothetical protein